MFEFILSRVQRISTWPVFWLFLVMYLVFAFALMPLLATSSDIPAGTTAPLDLLFSYPPEVAFAHVQSLGEAGRNLSAVMHLTLDVAYPIVYSLLFAVILCMTLRYLAAGTAWAARTKWLPLLPFVILDFDLLENFGISYLMMAWPQQPETIAKLTSFATSGKWSLVVLVLSLVLLLSLLALFKRLSAKT